jgi:hypothetical protein
LSFQRYHSFWSSHQCPICIPVFPPPFVLHALSISYSLTWSSCESYVFVMWVLSAVSFMASSVGDIASVTEYHVANKAVLF